MPSALRELSILAFVNGKFQYFLVLSVSRFVYILEMVFSPLCFLYILSLKRLDLSEFWSEFLK